MVTLTESPQAFARVRIRLDDGKESTGAAAELLAPKWFDKSPALSNEQNFDQLRTSLAMARRSMLAAGTDTPFGLSAQVDGPHHDACAAIDLNGLVASYGLALIDRAIIDALGRVEGGRWSAPDAASGPRVGPWQAGAPGRDVSHRLLLCLRAWSGPTVASSRPHVNARRSSRGSNQYLSPISLCLPWHQISCGRVR